MNYIGMDLHQKTTTWFACDEQGQRVGSGKIDSNFEGWKSMLQRVGSQAQVAIETGSITWFCVEQLRMLGVEPTRHGGITHQGRSLLRHALTQAAHSALRGRALAERHRTWARSLDARRGRQVAVIALARRLLVIAHQMWLTGELYDPKHRSTPTAPTALAA